MRHTLAGKCAVVCVVVYSATLAIYSLGERIALNGPLLFLLTWLFGLVATVLLVRWMTKPFYRRLQALQDGADNLKDRDFSVQLSNPRHDELSELVQIFNEMTQSMQRERHDLYQRELMLHTIVENAPLALILVGPRGRVRFHNRTARTLFDLRREDASLTFQEILMRCPKPIAEAVARGSDSLVSFEVQGRNETYHLMKRPFTLNTLVHEMFLFRPMTQELHREEVQAWKKIIRVIAHELNNSLAPISSLIHSAKRVRDRPEKREHLDRIFDSVQDRLDHLLYFLQGYARFARLPDPDPHPVVWQEFLARLQAIYQFRIVGKLPTSPAYFDEAQVEQVLINLIKNAREAGSPEDQISVSVSDTGDQVQLIVQDRGSGMSQKVMNAALLPFYSTKEQGSGLGLALCREVFERHGGHLELINRNGGGLRVVGSIPRGRPT